MLKNLISLVIGLAMIIFYKKAGKGWVKAQYFLTKREYSLQSFNVPWIIVGVGFVIIGIIDLLKYFSRK